MKSKFLGGLLVYIRNFLRVSITLFLDPPLWSEGSYSYELGSLCPLFSLSIFLSQSFLGIVLLDFFEIKHGVRGSWIFLKNIFYHKNWEYEPKNRVFLIYWKI